MIMGKRRLRWQLEARGLQGRRAGSRAQIWQSQRPRRLHRPPGAVRAVPRLQRQMRLSPKTPHRYVCARCCRWVMGGVIALSTTCHAHYSLSVVTVLTDPPTSPLPTRLSVQATTAPRRTRRTRAAAAEAAPDADEAAPPAKRRSRRGAVASASAQSSDAEEEAVPTEKPKSRASTRRKVLRLAVPVSPTARLPCPWLPRMQRAVSHTQ